MKEISGKNRGKIIITDYIVLLSELFLKQKVDLTMKFNHESRVFCEKMYLLVFILFNNSICIYRTNLCDLIAMTVIIHAFS